MVKKHPECSPSPLLPSYLLVLFSPNSLFHTVARVIFKKKSKPELKAPMVSQSPHSSPSRPTRSAPDACLQCSCLENPRDRGAWWAAAYGVTQSWTRLKRLSSSQREGKRLTPWSEQVLFCLPWVWDHFYSNISSRKNQERKKLYCISLSVTFLYKHCLYMKKSLS